MRRIQISLLQALVLVMLLAGLPTAAFAKSMYMTVRRDFSPQESAVIELNYRTTAPIQLRVLAPKDMKSFIASQIDLRRAWRQPRAEFNPMHFLLQSHNDASFNTDWIRRGANVDMRKSVPELGGGANGEGATDIPPGPERVISTPDAFTLVTEQTITPESEDKTEPFDVPGFSMWWEGYERELKTKMVELPKLAPGFYLVQTVQGDSEGQVVVVINDLVAQLQQSSDQAIYRVVDRKGNAVKGASVSIRSLQGNWIQEGRTDGNGEWVVKGLKDTELLTVVQTPSGGTAIIDSEFYATTAVFPDLYLYTDRPMYRRGDKVSFRGILRQMNQGANKPTALKPGSKVTVQLVSLDGTTTAKKTTVSVTEFGTFSGTLETGDNAEGVYRVVATVNGADHVGELRVKDYVKPLFFVTVNSKQETLHAGQELVASVKAERYAGGVPSVPKATVQLYRVKMTTPQWAEDAGLGESGSIVTYGFDQTQSESPDLPILIDEKTDIDLGDKAETEVRFKVPAEVPGSPGYDYKFLLKVTVTDADGNYATSSREFMDLNSEVTAQARFSSVLAEAGKKLDLRIRSVTPSGKPYANSKGTVEFKLTPYSGSERSLSKVDVTTNAEGVLVLTAPTPGNGELKAIVTLKDSSGRASTTEATTILASEPPARGVVRVSEPRMVTADSIVTPGETIRILALLPESWGANGSNKGNLYLTVAGRGIHDRRVIPLDGLGTWIEQKVDPSFGTAVTLILSYADSQNGWIERRATFRIVDATKALKLTITPAKATAIPGGQQSIKVKAVGQDGRPVKAELSIAVVDRSVLDLQPEIRPTLLDFFYPTDRLNLMTFISSQFQSYGYAEKIARLYKPNYWFAATKSRSDALDQVDTAFWSGTVVTDANGEATVSFKLPGNQTIWRVITVAADTEGRFGEATKEFKANLPVTMLLGYPQFLRRGDQAQLRVNLTSTEPKSELPLEYDFLPSDQITSSAPISVHATIKPSEQISKVTTISAASEAEPQTTSLLTRMKIAGSELSFRNMIKIQSDLTDTPETIDPVNGRFTLAIAKGEKLRSATLRIASGLYGSIAPSLRWLISYPYGCVEQLTSSTIPNLVFAGILEDSKVVLSKEEKELLSHAKEFAKAGMTRLKSYRRADGAYSWFNSESAGDLNMTLLVMTVMTGVENDRLVNFYEHTPTLEWLNKQSIQPASPQGIALSYIQSGFQKMNASYMSESAVIPNLKLQAEWALAQRSVSDRSLLLLAIKRFEMKDSGLESLRTKLLAAVRRQLDGLNLSAQSTQIRPGDWVPVEDGWQAYPGRMASAIALAAHAVKVNSSTKDLPANFFNEARARLLERFDGESFGSTFETSNALLHSEWIIREELKSANKSSLDQAATLMISGKAPAANMIKRKPTLGGVDIEIDPKILASGGDVTLSGLGARSTARLVTRKGTPLADSKAITKSWNLARSYFKIGSKGEKTPFNPAQEKVKVGDLIFVQVDFSRLQNRISPWASRYYVMTEDVPAGFGVLEDDKVYQASPYSLPIRNASFRVRELGSEQVRWYFDFSRGWMDRPGTVGFVMRANYAGRFATGVTRIQDFYDEEQFSQTQSFAVSVDPLASR